jgi:hypothetical protein
MPLHSVGPACYVFSQVVREVLPNNKVNLTITVPGSICQEGFTETVKIMRK